MPAPDIWRGVLKIFIQFRFTNFSPAFVSRKAFKYSSIPIRRAAYRITYNSFGFLIPRCIARFWFDRTLTRGKYIPKSKIMRSKCYVVVLLTSTYNVSSWRHASPRNSIQRYWIFTQAASVPDTSIVIWKFRMNNKNSSGLPSSNKVILNSQIFDLSDVGSPRIFIFTQYLSNFLSFLLLINIIVCGYMFVCTAPRFQIFLWKTFFVLYGFVCFGFLGDCFAKCHIP